MTTRLTLDQRLQQRGLTKVECSAVKSLMATGLKQFRDEQTAIDAVLSRRKQTTQVAASDRRQKGAIDRAKVASKKAFAATKGKHMSERVAASSKAFRNTYAKALEGGGRKTVRRIDMLTGDAKFDARMRNFDRRIAAFDRRMAKRG